MKIKINQKKFLTSIFSIIILSTMLILNSVYVDSGGSVEWSRNITPFILTLFFCSLLIIRNMIPRKRTLLYIVSILYFIFHFSHVFLQGLDYDFGTNTRNNVFFRQITSNVFKATHIEITAFIGLLIGFILFYLFYKEKPISKEKMHIDKNGKALATIMILVGLAADIIYSGMAIIALLTLGYAGVQDTISGTFYGVKILSCLLLAGVLILVQNREISKKKRRSILVIFIIYKVIMMISGLRAYGLINIFVASYVYFRNVSNQKIKLKHIIFGLVILQLGGGLIVGIREARTTGMDIALIVSCMFDLRSNIVFNMMSEFGITQNVICEVIQGTNGNANMGRQLLYSLIIVIPGISHIAPNLNYDTAFLEDSLQIHNYGGSYVADILFDFGQKGVLIGCIVLGLFFAALYEWFEREIQENNKLYIAVASPIIVEFIFCVRSSMAKMPRMTAWYLIIVFIIWKITGAQSRKVKEYGKE